ncbi:MAG: bifunctional diaminohydroxyphosphoribosylaminopyrimidine deaminase/5-amino-6-(5-phosphoribosylamino)uracil reductase RibD [Verrucomicrobia bacterium]|nr:bifunctional diaminohydroxyphosphoribosylaminopyrimidine deaminase/5-amino-6-(5-phosphoribosylamino)uracil reductase RibD [Verrucomicrobiota bacterium]
MRVALRLARRAYGATSPNPLVGAVLVKHGRIIGRGWHRQAGGPHAEIEAIHDAESHDRSPKGATLYVTLEPCSTHGRTPPCTDALQRAGIKRVIAAATDPNPRHAGRGYRLLRKAGIRVEHGLLASEAERLNEAFNRWMVRRTPFVTVKAGMTLDGKIATASGQSKWITSKKARDWAMRLRRGADAILVGINTVLADDPSLTIRGGAPPKKILRRIILDSRARTPVTAQVVCDDFASATTIVVAKTAPERRVERLANRVKVWVAPARTGRVDLRWVLRKLGSEDVTSLLVEGGGEVNAAFLAERLAHRVVFFYAPKILGGADARKAVAGSGARSWAEILKLRDVEWRRLGPDLVLTARVE